ncbi:Serine/threonine kinase [Tulasnella sp. UAMH 9824]|nr:Serine/threonine kinase [Tulasnella sp. UAMH 9824]
MTLAFQRLKIQASNPPVEEAPPVDGAATTEPGSTGSSGDVYQAIAPFSPAGQVQPLLQQQQVQERRIGNDIVATNKPLAEIHGIGPPPQRTQPQPRSRLLPPIPNVQQYPPQQIEQIASRMGQMSMQDPHRPAEVKPPPPPPLPPSYGRPDEREPDRYEYAHRADTAPQQRFTVVQPVPQRTDSGEMERMLREEQEQYYAQRLQQIPQQRQQKPSLPMYLQSPSTPNPGAYECDNCPLSGALPPPRAYPPQPADPRYASAQQQLPAAPERPQPQPQRQQVQRRRTKRGVGLDDFDFLAVLGKGHFGKVVLAEEKKTKGLFAIKILKKEFIIDREEIERTQSMKRVFLAAARENYPFLLRSHACFQTETRVYFAMEYVGGGNLMYHMRQKLFSLRQAKFYAQEILLALGYLHSQGIVHRNFILENILLTVTGHVKLAGYYLCKEEMWHGSTTGTFCGTPEFMAPETLLEQKYGKAVDWGDDEDEIFDAILEDEPIYPPAMPRDGVSVLQRLLDRDPNRRLGSGKSDAEEIKQHPFFENTNWDDVLNQRIPPPYFPTITSARDTSNFGDEFTREYPTFTPVHGQLSAQEQAEFKDFSWTADWADV